MEDDPLDIRRVLSDVTELLCHEIITDGTHRIDRSNQLNYFLDSLGGHIQHGRLYSHVVLASVMFDICARDPYRTSKESHNEEGGEPRGPGRSDRSGGDQTGTEDEDKDENGSGGKGEKEDRDPVLQPRSDFTPLSDFSVEKWDVALRDVEELRAVLLRRDAARVAVPRRIRDYPTGEAGEHDEEEAGDDGDGELNDGLASSTLFAQNYKDVINAIRFQQSFSHIRADLEDEVVRADREGRDTLHVEAKNLKAYEEFVSSHFREGHGIRDCLESILVKGDTGEHSTRSAGLALKSAKEVAAIIRGKNFDLARFQRKIEIILRKWYEAVLTPPTLAQLGYGEARRPERGAPAEVGDDRESAERPRRAARRPPRQPRTDDKTGDSGAAAASQGGARGRKRRDDRDVYEHGSPATSTRSSAGRRSPRKRQAPSELPEINALRQARDRLREDAKDPLDECQAQAEQARSTGGEKPAAVTAGADDDSVGQSPPHTPSMQRKKKRRHQETFDDSDIGESDDGDSDGGRKTTLSQVPERFNMPRPKRTCTPARRPIHVKQRRSFTEEEKCAIKLGVERFGFGRWKEIKDYYFEELKSRTTVQIKDCYRTMMKNNEL